MVSEHLSPGSEVIWKYFDITDDHKREKIEKLGKLYQELNKHVNVISRKDIAQLYLHHVLHSLSIAKTSYLMHQRSVLDLGTGGGFPGIPLAIMFPDIRFDLIDGTRKKIKVVEEVVGALGLKNVYAQHLRAEEFNGTTDIIITRAVARTSTILQYGKRIFHQSGKQTKHREKYLLLKGGDVKEEVRDVSAKYQHHLISSYFEESYFLEKYILYVER